eukprot:1091147-Heterocapsa_arctica.AAC.1
MASPCLPQPGGAFPRPERLDRVCPLPIRDRAGAMAGAGRRLHASAAPTSWRFLYLRPPPPALSAAAWPMSRTKSGSGPPTCTWG